MVCFFSQDQHLFLNLCVTLNQSDQKNRWNSFFIYHSARRDTWDEIIFWMDFVVPGWFFRLYDFHQHGHFHYLDDFFFSKKSSRLYFLEKDFLLSATPETIILLGPISKTKKSLKYWLPIYKQWRCCFETLLHLTVCSPKKFNGHGISIKFHKTFWCHQMLLRVSQGMDGSNKGKIFYSFIFS